jgi:lysophospholipase L1-like esterase
MRRPEPRGEAKLPAHRRALFGAFLALLGILLLELLLFAAERSSDRVGALLRGVPRAVPDARLGERPNPALAQHDARGWRNALRPEQSFAVAIGDSQTYGEEVRPEEAWPQRLAALSGRSVYNISLGGYGPVEYERLLDEAFELSPHVVLVGLYSGNDLADAYLSAYPRALAPALRSEDPELRGRCASLDATRDLKDAWEATREARKGSLQRLARFAQSSRTFLLARAAWRVLESRAARASDDEPDTEVFENLRARAARAGGDLLLPFQDAALATVLTPAARLAVLDTGDPRVEEGLRIALAALLRMADRCAGRCAFAVVGIPTKELVFAERVRASGASATPVLAELALRETLVWERIRRSLRDAGIPFVDTLPVLRTLVAAARNPYRDDWNGHLVAAGNQAIAEAVLAAGVLDLAQRPASPRGADAARVTHGP